MRKGEERRMLDDLADLTNLGTWETDFVYSLIEQLDEEESGLTPKQLAKLTEIHERRVLGY